ncbi:MAG: hypothetical protein MR669_06355 [Selenomonadaceae bacterium]|nr:hypothetical protein [Selenomonadaceae bacterium]
MFLHIGDGVSVDLREVIGIFDAGLFTGGDSPAENADFLDWERRKKRVSPLDTDQNQAKSLVVAEDGDHWSILAPSTLYGRSKDPWCLGEFRK